MDESATNIWDFLSTVATIGIPATVTIITYLLTRRGQDPKIDRIEAATNGNLDAEKARVRTLEAQVRDMGGEP